MEEQEKEQKNEVTTVKVKGMKTLTTLVGGLVVIGGLDLLTKFTLLGKAKEGIDKMKESPAIKGALAMFGGANEDVKKEY